MAEVKGNRFIHRLDYLRAHDPGGAEERILADMDPEFVRQLRKGLIKNQWYPIGEYAKFHRLLDRHLGQGDGVLVRELGRLSARDAFKGIYRVFFKVGSPEFIIHSAPILWRQLYNSGTMRIEAEPEAGRSRHRMVISGFDEPYEELWQIMEGWIEGTLALAGVKHVKVWRSPQPRYPGSNAEILASWDAVTN